MKRYSFVVCLLTVTARLASAQPAPTAIIVQQYTFAPAGIAAGQTMRLNMANVAGGASICIGNLSFVNSDGTSIKNQDVTVKAGQTMSFSLLSTDLASTSAEIRGVVKVDRQFGGVVVTPGTPPVPICNAVISLEIVDTATGQSRVVLTNPSLVSGIIPLQAPVPPTVVH
jgi:hypothetical protein